VLAFDDPASMALQPSTRDETKACTNVFADSVSSERRILRMMNDEDMTDCVCCDD